MKTLQDKINSLAEMLNARNNKSSEYFKLIIKELNDENQDTTAVLRRLYSGTSIVQYANFTEEEEILYDEIWKEVKDILTHKDL